MISFTLSVQSEGVRLGILHTPRGDVPTPLFMPVGTHGFVKGLSADDLVQAGSGVVLANTYHLHLRPGEETVAALGGTHGLMGWHGPMLTDSGGFQVFSLGEKRISGDDRPSQRRITEAGVTFRSHLDGREVFLGPEESIKVQEWLGADIIMAFDQPVYGLTGELAAREAMERSMRWLDRCVSAHTTNQALFGIVQGGTHIQLVRESAAHVVSHNLPGNAIGGLSVGESQEAMWEAIASTTPLLPLDRPRYVMGLGASPHDLLQAFTRGVDMVDCVAPTRMARHGTIWSITGKGARAFWEGDTRTLIAHGVEFRRIALRGATFAGESLKLVPEGVFPEGFGHPSLGALRHGLVEHEAGIHRYLSFYAVRLMHLVALHLRNAAAERNVQALLRAVS